MSRVLFLTGAPFSPKDQSVVGQARLQTPWLAQDHEGATSSGAKSPWDPASRLCHLACLLMIVENGPDTLCSLLIAQSSLTLPALARCGTDDTQNGPESDRDRSHSVVMRRLPLIEH